MPTLRQRIADMFLGDERRKLGEAVTLLQQGYYEGPYQMPPDQLMKKLREVNPYLLEDYLATLGWESLGYTASGDAERRRAVNDAKRLWKYSPLAQWSIWLWTGWGLGDEVKITLDEEAANAAWEEFWTADRNSRILGADRIQGLSEWLLVKGNRLLIFFASSLDAHTTVRVLDQDEVTILTNPEDNQDPWFYKRTYSVTAGSTGVNKVRYYPDWLIYFNDRVEETWEKLVAAGTIPAAEKVNRIDQVKNNANANAATGDNALQTKPTEAPTTGVCVYHIPHNQKDENMIWGWPITTTAAPSLRTRQQFVRDRAAAVAAVAMFVRRKKVTGGTRSMENVLNTISTSLSATQSTETNPPATAGSVELDNAMIDTKDLPLKTGASDAKADNEMFTHQALIGMGLFPTSAGLDTARWATALQMDKAQATLFARYQTFWASQFKNMVRIVLWFYVKFGKAKVDMTKKPKVSVDNFSLTDFPDVAESIGDVAKDLLFPAIDHGTIPVDTGKALLATLWRIVLQALGQGDATELTSDEAFAIEALATAPDDVIGRIGRAIAESAKNGEIDWEKAGKWAFETLVDVAGEG